MTCLRLLPLLLVTLTLISLYLVTALPCRIMGDLGKGMSSCFFTPALEWLERAVEAA